MKQDTTSAYGEAAAASSEGPVSLTGDWAPDTGKIGICCSGGGVRSASFTLGALQALQAAGVLGRARYLASVSGGGYTAGAMTMVAGTQPRDLVWGEGVPKPFEPGSPEEVYLRNRSSYLAPGITGKLRLLANLLRGLLLNVAVLGAALVLAGMALGWYTPHADSGIVRYLGVRVPVVLLVTLVLWTMVRGMLRPKSGRDEDIEMLAMRLLFRGALGCWLVFAVAPWLVTEVRDAALSGWLAGLLDSAYGLVGRDKPAGAHAVTTLGQIGAILAALGIPALLAGAARTVLRGAGAVLGRIAIWLVVPLLSATLVLTVAVATSQGMSFLEWTWFVLAFGVVTVAAVGADINAGSMHRFYKRRLCTAFALQRVWRNKRGDLAPRTPGDGGRLDAIERDYDDRVPFSSAVHGSLGTGSWPQLICCAAANIGAQTVTPPGRRAVTFTFDSEWFGGPQVGYARTADYEDLLGDTRAEDVTIPAAVAISGAALAPCMGIMTKPYLRALLTLVNARLGVWLPSPSWINKHKQDGHRLRWYWSRPRFTSLLREMTGKNRHDSNFLYVTDGGHWENLGLVELLRRGCGTIYCIDASGDHEDTFFTIGQAISMARSELGVDIDLRPDTMRPDPADPLYCTDDHVVGHLTFRSVPGAVLPVHGRIAFIKAQVTRDAPWDVRAYKEKDPAFPNHSLLEQMFADQTFEAYRALGYHAATRAAQTMAGPVTMPEPRAAATPVENEVQVQA